MIVVNIFIKYNRYDCNVKNIIKICKKKNNFLSSVKYGKIIKREELKLTRM